MIGLLRAEWLRLRRRRDIWFVGLALIALSVPAYASGLSSAESSMNIPQGEDLPPDFLAEIEEQMRRELARFAFPESIGSVVQTGQILVLALVAYLAAAISGAEFAYGTIRTSLVAHADRRGFLMVRLAAVAFIGILLVGLLVVLGALLPLGAGLLGREWPEASTADIVAIIAPLAVLVLAVCFVIGLTTVWAILLRNAAIALVLTIAYVFIDGALHGLIVRIIGGEEQALVGWLLPVANLQLLFERARGASTGAGFPTLLAIGVAVGWMLVVWVGSVWLLARADIRD